MDFRDRSAPDDWFVIGVGNRIDQDEQAHLEMPNREGLLKKLDVPLAPRLLWSDKVAKSFGVYTPYVGR